VASPETTCGAAAAFAPAIARRIRTIFPLGTAGIARSGRRGRTDRARHAADRPVAPGLWVASGFGRQGLNTTAMAGQLIGAASCGATNAGGCFRRRTGLAGARPAGSPAMSSNLGARKCCRRRCGAVIGSGADPESRREARLASQSPGRTRTATAPAAAAPLPPRPVKARRITSMAAHPRVGHSPRSEKIRSGSV